MCAVIIENVLVLFSKILFPCFIDLPHPEGRIWIESVSQNGAEGSIWM
jgi:hypothetical protein